MHALTSPMVAAGSRRLRRQRLLAAAFMLWLLAAGAALAEAVDGLQLATEEGGWQPAAMLETSATLRIRGLLAEVELRQRFVNDSSEWLEGRYLLPLPEDSAVHALTLEVGDRRIEGEVREKQAARAEYAAAVAGGQRSALLEQNRPNLFRTQVANIPPGGEVTVTVGYWQRVRVDAGEFSLHLPLTLTPRYQGGCTECEPAPQAVPAVAAAGSASRALPPTVSIEAELEAGVELASVSSPTHAITVQQHGELHHVRLQDFVVGADREFVLAWRPAPSAEVGSAVFAERIGGSDHVLLMLVPPTLAVQALPREVVLVVDTSGSMHGTSIEQARAALADALDRLAPTDRFNLVRFDSHTEALFEHPVPADGAHLAVARDWAAALVADGGTELAPALSLALAGQPPAGWLRQVVLLTDAAIGNERELLAQVERELGASRLFPVGIGSAPNGHFLQQAARLGRGSAVLVRDIGEVEAQMDRLFTRIDTPALRDVQVDWPAGAEVYPERLPDLYAGEPLFAVARLDPATMPGTLQARGVTRTGAWQQRVTLHGLAVDDAGVARLWAREKLAALEDLLRQGRTEDTVRPLMLEVALEHQLASRYTSFVAVDRTPARPQQAALQSTRFANADPAGNVAFASGGTGSRSRLAIAAAIALLGLALTAGRRRAEDNAEAA